MLSRRLFAYTDQEKLEHRWGHAGKNSIEILSLFYKKSHEIKIKDLTQTQFRTSVHHNSHTNRFFNCAHFLSLEER